MSYISYLEFLVRVALVTHHGAGARGGDGVSVEINHPVVATRKKVPGEDRETYTI